MLPVSLDFPFLIAPSVFSNVYLQSRQNKKESMTSLVGNVLSALAFICMFFHETTFPISSMYMAYERQHDRNSWFTLKTVFHTVIFCCHFYHTCETVNSHHGIIYVCTNKKRIHLFNYTGATVRLTSVAIVPGIALAACYLGICTYIQFKRYKKIAVFSDSKGMIPR